MSKTTIESFELGNLAFGNSRGPYRELVNHDEWTTLINTLLQMDYHCIMEAYYYDYDTCQNKARDNGLTPSPYSGYICKDHNDTVLFEIFPYYWDECSCGAEQNNELLEEKLKASMFSEEERKIYESYDTWCEDECPACSWKPENNELYKAHSSDCLLLKHNFIYKPGTKDEFWIDWYKYPFRNSFMSKDISIDEIKKIWLECQEAVRKKINHESKW